MAFVLNYEVFIYLVNIAYWDEFFKICFFFCVEHCTLTLQRQKYRRKAEQRDKKKSMVLPVSEGTPSLLSESPQASLVCPYVNSDDYGSWWNNTERETRNIPRKEVPLPFYPPQFDVVWSGIEPRPQLRGTAD